MNSDTATRNASTTTRAKTTIASAAAAKAARVAGRGRRKAKGGVGTEVLDLLWVNDQNRSVQKFATVPATSSPQYAGAMPTTGARNGKPTKLSIALAPRAVWKRHQRP